MTTWWGAGLRFRPLGDLQHGGVAGTSDDHGTHESTIATTMLLPPDWFSNTVPATTLLEWISAAEMEET
jgi:hypothetical protein